MGDFLVLSDEDESDENDWDGPVIVEVCSMQRNPILEVSDSETRLARAAGG
jgi:hypothetical protein